MESRHKQFEDEAYAARVLVLRVQEEWCSGVRKVEEIGSSSRRLHLSPSGPEDRGLKQSDLLVASAI